MGPGDATPSVTVEEAYRKLQEGVRLVDVRERHEWGRSRVPGTELRPMSEINDWYPELDPAAEVLFLCRSGDRSGRVVEALTAQAGFTAAYNIAGGILDWAEEGLPLEPGDAGDAG